MDSNELMHHGVLGMKWGVRRDRDSTGSPGRKRKKGSKVIKPAQPRTPPSEDYLNKLRTKNKMLSSLTNAELRVFNERMQLEQTYTKLTEKPKSKLTSTATRILAASAEKTATYYVSQYMKAGIGAIIGDPLQKEKKEK